MNKDGINEIYTTSKILTHKQRNAFIALNGVPIRQKENPQQWQNQAASWKMIHI